MSALSYILFCYKTSRKIRRIIFKKYFLPNTSIVFFLFCLNKRFDLSYHEAAISFDIFYIPRFEKYFVKKIPREKTAGIPFSHVILINLNT